MKVVGLIVVAAISVLLLAGCGGGGDETAIATQASQPACPRATKPPGYQETGGTQPSASRGAKLQGLNFTIDGRPSAKNAGALVAARRGYFADVGLAVSPQDPVTPVNVIGYVVGKGSAFGIAYQPQVVAAVDKGLPVVAVGSLVPKAHMGLIWLRNSGIESVADLEGRTIAFTGFSFERDFLRFILERAGLSLDDVKLERVDYGLVPALAAGSADVAFASSWGSEETELRAEGLRPVVRPLRSLGVLEFEELVVITHRDRLEEDPESIRAFMSALARGTKTAFENPAVAEQAIVAARAFYEIDSFVPKPTVTEVESASRSVSRTGRMSPKRAGHLASWMCRQGMVERKLSPSAFLTNRYLSAGS